MKWMLAPLWRYADFAGRSRRLEYWMFTLLLLTLLLGGSFLAGFLGALVDGSGKIGGLAILAVVGLLYLGLLVPILAVQVRRLHDQDKSGWFVLLGLVPYVGGLILFVLMCIDGTPGPNRFGPDPKGRGDTIADIFA